MKKFKFSMEKVLTFKENVQSNEECILRSMRDKYNLLLIRRDKLLLRYDLKKNELKERFSAGFEIKDIKMLQNYIYELQRELKTNRVNIIFLSREIEKQVQIVKKINSEKTMIEKLKDKNYDIHKYLERREHENFIDEFVNNTSSGKVNLL